MKRDWFRVITDLERAGLSHQAIADELGVSKGTIAYWKSGGEPRHSDGEKLLRIHEEHCKDLLPLPVR